MASSMKKMKKSKAEENKYSQLSYKADTVEELNQSSASAEFLPVSTKKWRNRNKRKITNNEFSQLPHEADETVEELSQRPASPKYLHTFPQQLAAFPKHSPATSQTPDSSSSSKSTQTEVAAKKENRKNLLTHERLLSVKSDKLCRTLAPIKKWGSLLEGHPYLLKRIISIPVHKKNDKQSGISGNSAYVKEIGHYAEPKREKDSMINVWITPLMLAESENFDLSSNDVYIIPLGKKFSQENRYEYHSFVIVRADDLEFN